jgi:hypothetical protein
MTAKSRKPVLLNVVLASVLLAVLYVLSYAPVVRFVLTSEEDPGLAVVEFPDGEVNVVGRRPYDGRVVAAYRPIDWLIDNTPLRAPLLWWADRFDMRFEFETASLSRSLPPSATTH